MIIIYIILLLFQYYLSFISYPASTSWIVSLMKESTYRIISQSNANNKYLKNYLKNICIEIQNIHLINIILIFIL